MPNSDVTKGQSSSPARSGDVFDTMRQEMNRLIDSFDRGLGSWPGLLQGRSGTPASFDIDIRDEGQAIVVEADVPGMAEKDISVTLSNGVLTIAGEKKSEREEKKDNYYLSERSFGSFKRSLRLPDTIDEEKIEAHIENGVLRIRAAKKPEAVNSERKIEIGKKS